MAESSGGCGVDESFVAELSVRGNCTKAAMI